MNRMREVCTAIFAIALTLPCFGSSNSATRASLDLRILKDLSELSFFDIARNPGRVWLVLNISPSPQSQDFGDLTVYIDPLTRRTKPLPGASGQIVSRIVGIAEVKGVISGDAPQSPFVYAWAAEVEVGAEASPKNGRHLSNQWPFKFCGGLAVCEYDPTSNGRNALPRVYAIPSAFEDQVLSAFAAIKANIAIYDPQYAAENQDRLRPALGGPNAMLACQAARLLADSGDYSSLTAAVRSKKGLEQAAVDYLSLHRMAGGVSDALYRQLKTCIESAETTRDLYPLALALIELRLGPDTLAGTRDLAAHLLESLRDKYKSLALGGAPDDYLNSLLLLKDSKPIP